MSSNDLVGWELLFNSVEKSLSKREDLLIAFLHWALIRSGFLCVGLGDGVEIKKEVKPTELLPEGWNKNDCYSIRYSSKKDEEFLLKASISREFLVLELVRLKDMTVAVVTLASRSVIPENNFNKPLSEVIPNYKTILDKYKTDLINKLYTSDNKEAETQTAFPPVSPSHPSYPSRLEQLLDGTRNNRESDRERYADPFGIGSADLNPLGVNSGPGAGGMIFDPFQPNRRLPPPHPSLGIPGGLPRGSIPPGSRFDPFGPPGIGSVPGRRPPPGADHLPPPGYDDMFM